VLAVGTKQDNPELGEKLLIKDWFPNLRLSCACIPTLESGVGLLVWLEV